MQDKLLDALWGCLEAEQAGAIEYAVKGDAALARQLCVLRFS
jgi:hypothetical protein